MRLTDDCVSSRDDAIQNAIKQDPMRKQSGHDFAHHPAKCSSYRRNKMLKLFNTRLMCSLKRVRSENTKFPTAPKLGHETTSSYHLTARKGSNRKSLEITTSKFFT